MYYYAYVSAWVPPEWLRRPCGVPISANDKSRSTTKKIHCAAAIALAHLNTRRSSSAFTSTNLGMDCPGPSSTIRRSSEQAHESLHCTHCTDCRLPHHTHRRVQHTDLITHRSAPRAALLLQVARRVNFQIDGRGEDCIILSWVARSCIVDYVIAPVKYFQW